MKKKMTRHHRRPKAYFGSNDKDNISIVPEKLHNCYHALFGHGGDVQNTANILNETWIDKRYFLIVVERETVDPNQLKLFEDET